MSFWLVMKTANGQERPFPIRSNRMVIGREARSDVRVAIPSVGANHCEITFDDSGLRLTDLHGSGTLHNGAPVREAQLKHLDEIRVGPVTFEVREVVDTRHNGVSIPEVKVLENGAAAARLSEAIGSDQPNGAAAAADPSQPGGA